MYEGILLPFDGSDSAAAVLHHASELAHWADFPFSTWDEGPICPCSRPATNPSDADGSGNGRAAGEVNE